MGRKSPPDPSRRPALIRRSRQAGGKGNFGGGDYVLHNRKNTGLAAGGVRDRSGITPAVRGKFGIDLSSTDEQ